MYWLLFVLDLIVFFCFLRVMSCFFLVVVVVVRFVFILYGNMCLCGIDDGDGKSLYVCSRKGDI